MCKKSVKKNASLSLASCMFPDVRSLGGSFFFPLPIVLSCSEDCLQHTCERTDAQTHKHTHTQMQSWCLFSCQGKMPRMLQDLYQICRLTKSTFSMWLHVHIILRAFLGAPSVVRVHTQLGPVPQHLRESLCTHPLSACFSVFGTQKHTHPPTQTRILRSPVSDW